MHPLENHKQYEFKKLGWVRLPQLEIDPLDKKNLSEYFREDYSMEGYLAALTRQAYSDKKKFGLIPPDREKEYIKRIKYELDVVNKLQFAPYFILVYKIVQFCKREGVLTSLGRGSAGGSLVFHLLGVTYLDPIKHSLLFERFLSSDRADTKTIDGDTYLQSDSLCDVDLDVENGARDKVIDYLGSIFGAEPTHISTMSTFTGKALIKDCLKVVGGLKEEDVQPISNSLEVNYGKVEKLAHAEKENEEFQALTKQYPDEVRIAKQLEGLVRQKGCHAAALFLSEKSAEETLPLEVNRKNNRITTSFEMNDAAKLGIKVDVLGLKTLSIIDHVFKKQNIGYDDIDLEDPVIYDFLKSTDKYYGLFQIGDGLGRQTVVSVKPDNLYQLAVCSGLGRPGALQYIPNYIRYKRGGEAHKIHPDVDKITEKTAGLLVWQEQLMEVSREIGGFTGLESNTLRAIVGKKKVEKMPEYEEKFKRGATERGYSEEVINEVWNVFLDSANYSFNLSHGISYSALTAICSYLKSKYTTDFFVGCLNIANDNDDLRAIFEELPHFNIQLLPPSLYSSEEGFCTDPKNPKNIRYGLSTIRSISQATIPKVMSLREGFDGKIEMFQVSKDAGLSIGHLTALIYSGCLDEFSNIPRTRLALEAQTYWQLTPTQRRLLLEHAPKYENDVFKTIKALNEVEKNLKGKPLLSDKNIESMRNKVKDFLDLYNHNKQHEKLTNFIFERHFLGQAITYNIREVFETRLQQALMSTEEIHKSEERDGVAFAGIVDKVKRGTANNKKQTKWFKLVTSDERGTVELVAFNDKIQQIKEVNKILPKENDIVYCRGRKSKDSVFIDDLWVQDEKVFLKVKDMK